MVQVHHRRPMDAYECLLVETSLQVVARLEPLNGHQWYRHDPTALPNEESSEASFGQHLPGSGTGPPVIPTGSSFGCTPLVSWSISTIVGKEAAIRKIA